MNHGSRGNSERGLRYSPAIKSEKRGSRSLLSTESRVWGSGSGELEAIKFSWLRSLLDGIGFERLARTSCCICVDLSDSLCINLHLVAVSSVGLHSDSITSKKRTTNSRRHSIAK